jgi:two-component system CheB/CheR fusion protein
MGLHIMNYRARIIGANLEITSKARRGTSVICTVNRTKT